MSPGEELEVRLEGKVLGERGRDTFASEHSVDRYASVQLEAALARHAQKEGQGPAASPLSPHWKHQGGGPGLGYETGVFGSWEPQNGVCGNELELTGFPQQHHSVLVPPNRSLG